MIKAPLAAALLLLGCSPDAPEAPEAKAAPAAARAATKPQHKAAAHETKETSADLEFTYGWPAEAAAIPKLAAQLRADLAKQRAEALDVAKHDRASREPGSEFNGHYLHMNWQKAGQSKELLSLVADRGDFTGGAHGNSSFHTILWDRAADRPIHIADVFADEPAALKLLTPPYCAALKKERETRRGEPVGPADPEDFMTACPPLEDVVMAPADADGDGRFERLQILLAPYVAGPYAEGPYELDLPMTPELKRLVKPQYASSF